MKLFHLIKAKINTFKMGWTIRREIKRYDKTLAHQLSHLKMNSNRTCYKCYGRGHVGFNRNTGMYVPCSCTQKSREDRMKEGFRKLKAIGWAATKFNDKPEPNYYKRMMRRRRANANG